MTLRNGGEKTDKFWNAAAFFVVATFINILGYIYLDM